MRESLIERRLREAVERAGGKCLKLPANLYRGIPDRLVLLPGGRVFFIELKTSKGKPSEPQIAFREFLQRLGFHSLIIYGISETDQFIQEHVNVLVSKA